jgi:aspartyl-tRNA(Asn)/glutamyl-tRNA(Gln) amidotransferase subunit A
MQMYLNDIYTVPVNIAGLTAVSLPCSLGSDGLPIGIQLIAKPMGEPEMLRAAYALEQAFGPIGTPTFRGGDLS